MESQTLKKFKNDMLSRIQAASFLNIDIRTLQRYLAVRSIPFIRIFFLEESGKGRVYFSKRKLSDPRFNPDPDNKESIANWKEETLRNKLFEIDEQEIALGLTRLYTKFARLVEELRDSLANETHNEIIKMEKELRTREEKRLEAFFSEGLEQKESDNDFYIEDLGDGKVLRLAKSEYIKIEAHSPNSSERFHYERRIIKK
ncbi:hypothetical protein ES703_23502 [subsurface metagenome]